MKLKITNLSKSFDDKKVLKDVNFTFESGKIYGLIGKNGAGKTTFFNCLNEDLEVDSGNFELIEDDISFGLNSSDIGYVISTPVVPEFLTAREFLEFFIEINKEKVKHNIDYYFDLVKISKKDQDKLLKDYSHGMKNKIQILVNIICEPKVILLDEPLTSLDIVVQEDMKKLLKNFKRDHIIIFSTHILELALDLCDEIVIINDGYMEDISKDNLNKANYKKKIIDSLKDVKND